MASFWISTSHQPISSYSRANPQLYFSHACAHTRTWIISALPAVVSVFCSIALGLKWQVDVVCGDLPSLDYRISAESVSKTLFREATDRGHFFKTNFPPSLQGKVVNLLWKKKKKEAGNKCVICSNLLLLLLAPSITVIFYFLWQILIEARKAIPVTGVNHTPFTDEHLPTLFFVVTDFISKGEGGEIKQTLSSSPCLHLVLLFDMIFQMSQKHHVQISAPFFEAENSRRTWWRRNLCWINLNLADSGE